MNSKSKRWLMLGIAGATFVSILFPVFVLLVAKYSEEVITLASRILPGVVAKELPEWNDQWPTLEQRHYSREQELAAEIVRLGLESKYDVVQLHDDTLQILYLDQNFPLVEERLSAELARCETPLDYYRYSQHIEQLGEFWSIAAPLQIRAVLNTWVESRPDSHHARLVSGKFRYNYFWSTTGFKFDTPSTRAGWVDPKQQLEQAQLDLELAEKINPSDPEIPALLMQVSATQRRGRDAVDEYFQKTVAICPYHFYAHRGRVHYAQPSYFGTWKNVDAFAAESALASDEFPLLLLMPRYAKSIRTTYGEISTEEWEKKQDFPASLAAYEAQLKKTPGDLQLMADAAYFAIKSNREERARHWFTELGNRYPEGSAFKNLIYFDQARTSSFAAHSETDGALP